MNRIELEVKDLIENIVNLSLIDFVERFSITINGDLYINRNVLKEFFPVCEINEESDGISVECYDERFNQIYFFEGEKTNNGYYVKKVNYFIEFIEEDEE